MATDFEYFATPDPFSKWLFEVLSYRAPQDISGRRCFEPCVGDGAIVRAAEAVPQYGVASRWVTNDIDPRWSATTIADATRREHWGDGIFGEVDFVVTNPAFTTAIDIATLAIQHAEIGVAMHLRASIHEVLKTGERRTWMREHLPSGILWLPRFAYQRSRSKGIWSTDSVCACWCIWLRAQREQFIDYAPTSVLDELEAFTPDYRERMDAFHGFTGPEEARQRQCVAFWKAAA